MISKKNYSKKHLDDVVKKHSGDKGVFERVLFAFGLLQSLVDVNLDFIFKGGTCLLLLLDEPKRFSTDIDILVKPDTNIDEFIEKAGKLFPFDRYEEHHRNTNNGIEKRHFKFEYTSILTSSPANIILDVVFEDNQFIETKSIMIKNSLIVTEEPAIFVNVPTIDYMIADKLTAFAPNTIGILYNCGKELEIIKQMHDVAILFDYVEDCEIVKQAYYKYAEVQRKYRNISDDYGIFLNDTIEACISILSNGEHFKDSQLYVELREGIRKINTHIFGRYTINKAFLHASKILYLSTVLKHNLKLDYVETVDNKELLSKKSVYANLNRIRKFDSEVFKYVKAAILVIDKI